MSGVDLTWGTYHFEQIGPDFYAFRLETESFTFKEFLMELGLVKYIKRNTMEFTDDFKEFLASMGYVHNLDVIVALKNKGLILRNDKAIEFKLRFL